MLKLGKAFWAKFWDSLIVPYPNLPEWPILQNCNITLAFNTKGIRQILQGGHNPWHVWWQNQALCSTLSSTQYRLCWQCLAHVWMGNRAEAWNAGFYCLEYWVQILHTLTFKVEDHARHCFQTYKFVSFFTMEVSLKFLVYSTNCFNLCLQARMGFVAEIIGEAFI